jgi:hypothetical protein
MFFASGLFWFFMGMITVLIGAGFKVFADDRGWTLNWWKWLLSILWYIIFSLSILTYGTLAGENEGSAGVKILLLGLFVCVVYGVGLWRLLAHKQKTEDAPDA